MPGCQFYNTTVKLLHVYFVYGITHSQLMQYEINKILFLDILSEMTIKEYPDPICVWKKMLNH